MEHLLPHVPRATASSNLAGIKHKSDEINADPAAISQWPKEKCQKYLVEICLSPTFHQIFVLQPLFASGLVSINDRMTVDNNGTTGLETPISLAIISRNLQLVEHLVHMGADLDIFVGCGDNPSDFGLDRLAPGDGDAEILKIIVDTAAKRGTTRTELTPAKNSIDCEYDRAELMLDPSAVESYPKERCAWLFDNFVRRRRRGATEGEFSLITTLISSGKVGVNDHLSDVDNEKRTALYEAVFRKNRPLVDLLIDVHHADPNVKCQVYLTQNDLLDQSTAFGVLMRGYRMRDEQEEKDMELVMDKLMKAGTSPESQAEAVMLVLRHEGTRLMSMELQECCNFLRYLRTLLGQTTAWLTRLDGSFTDLLVLMLKDCEYTWHENSTADIDDASFPELLPAAMACLMAVQKVGLPPPNPETLAKCIAFRAYLTVAQVVHYYGGAVSLPPSIIDQLEPDEDANDAAKESNRLAALITVLYLTTAAGQRWTAVLKHLEEQVSVVGLPTLWTRSSLKNLARAAVVDNLRTRRLKFADLPPVDRSLTMFGNEFTTLATA